MWITRQIQGDKSDSNMWHFYARILLLHRHKTLCRRWQVRCSWTMEPWLANWRWNTTRVYIITIDETIWSLTLRHTQLWLLSRESIISNGRVFCERCGRGASQFLQTADTRHITKETLVSSRTMSSKRRPLRVETIGGLGFWEKNVNRLLSSFCAMWGQIDILQWTLIDTQLGEKQQLQLIIE